jgi:hypothetical protein
MLRIQRGLEIFKNMELDKKLLDVNYDEAIKIICSKDVVQTANIFLYRINRLLNPDRLKISRKQTRIFLTCYLLNKHLEYVLTTIDKKARQQLWSISHDFLNFIHNKFMRIENFNNYDVQRFGMMFNTYCYNYNIFLEQDKYGLLEELIREYHNVSITIKYIETSCKYDKHQKERVYKELERHTNMVKNEIKMIDKDFDMKKLDDIDSTITKLKHKFNDELVKKITKELCDNKYSILLDILNDMKEIIYDLTPQKNKVDEKKELDTYIDLDFIENNMKNNVMTGMDYYTLMKFIWNKLISRQAIVRDNDTNKKWLELENKFLLLSNNVDKNGTCKLIVECFKYMYEIIDNIFCDVLLLHI